VYVTKFLNLEDWELKVDLGKQLKFPENAAATTLRPNMVLISEASKLIVFSASPLRWDAEGSQASPSVVPTTR